MRKSMLVAVLVSGCILGSFALSSRDALDAGGKEHLLSHDVYFSLKDKKNTQKLVEACHKYLRNHPGEVFYAAGPRSQELEREVNDKDFDVALHIVFKDKAAHDVYQDAPRHKQFIEENKGDWAKVRVFDSNVSH
jgi:quinol monooxygenase YgiN